MIKKGEIKIGEVYYTLLVVTFPEVRIDRHICTSIDEKEGDDTVFLNCGNSGTLGTYCFKSMEDIKNKLEKIHNLSIKKKELEINKLQQDIEKLKLGYTIKIRDNNDT